MMNFSMQQDWWMLVSMLALAFGVGFWGGILQHSHLNAGDGGTLTTYQRVATVNLTPAQIASNNFPFLLASVAFPATQVLPTSRLIFEAWGDVIQNTGAPANAPTFVVDLDGGAVASVDGTALSLASSPTARGLYCKGEYQMRNSVASSIRDQVGLITQNLTNLAALLENKARAESFLDFSTGVTVNVRATNAVNSALYTTRFWKLAITIA